MPDSENKKQYSLHEIVDFSIGGRGPLFDYLIYQHQYFATKDQSAKIGHSALKLEVVKKLTWSNGGKLKNGNEDFAVDVNHQHFYWSVGNQRVSLDGKVPLKGQTCLTFESDFNRMKANLICELVWRLKFADEGVALVHAACVTKNGRSLLLPAWKGMGKTAACLKLLEAGYDFMADDRVWISSSGVVYGYPRYVVIKDSNAAFFPEFTTGLSKIKKRLFQHVEKVSCISRTGLFQRLKRFIMPPKYFYIDELFPSTNTVKTSIMTDVFCVVKSERVQEIVLKSSDWRLLASATWLTGNVEWNYSLLNFAAAHDLLFPEGPSWTEEIQTLMRQERQIINTAFNDTNCAELELPADEGLVNWEVLPEKVSAQ